MHLVGFGEFVGKFMCYWFGMKGKFISYEFVSLWVSSFPMSL